MEIEKQRIVNRLLILKNRSISLAQRITKDHSPYSLNQMRLLYLNQHFAGSAPEIDDIGLTSQTVYQLHARCLIMQFPSRDYFSDYYSRILPQFRPNYLRWWHFRVQDALIGQLLQSVPNLVCGWLVCKPRLFVGIRRLVQWTINGVKRGCCCSCCV